MPETYGSVELNECAICRGPLMADDGHYHETLMEGRHTGAIKICCRCKCPSLTARKEKISTSPELKTYDEVYGDSLTRVLDTMKEVGDKVRLVDLERKLAPDPGRWTIKAILGALLQQGKVERISAHYWKIA